LQKGKVKEVKLFWQKKFKPGWLIMQRIQRKNDKKGIGRNGSLSYKKEMISKVTTKPQPFMLEKVSFFG